MNFNERYIITFEQNGCKYQVALMAHDKEDAVNKLRANNRKYNRGEVVILGVEKAEDQTFDLNPSEHDTARDWGYDGDGWD